MQEKNVPERKPGQGMPEPGTHGGETDVGKKGGEQDKPKPGQGDVGRTGEVGKHG